MLLSRSLPPHFLLPAWGTRQLLRTLQRAHSNTIPDRRPSKPLCRTHRNKVSSATHYHGKQKSRRFSDKAEPIKKHLESTKPIASLVDDQEAQKTTSARKASSNEPPPFPRLMRNTKAKNFFDQQPVIRYHAKQERPVVQRSIEVARDPELNRTDGASNPEPTPWGFSGLSMGEEAFPRSSSKISKNGFAKADLPEQKSNGSLHEGKRYESSRIVYQGPMFSSMDGGNQMKQSASQHEYIEPEDLFKHKPSSKSTSKIPPKQMQPSTPSSSNEKSLKTNPKSRSVRNKPAVSLFDELFPEENEAGKQSEKKSVDKLPSFEWHNTPEIDWKETVQKVTEKSKTRFNTTLPAAPTPSSTDTQMREQPEVGHRKSNIGVLVLKGASKTLEESDFFRLGSKGQHIEGWTSGILKVIQGRDAATLEPLGHYYLVFSSEAAASAYLDHTIKLHRLSNSYGSGVSPLSFPSKILRPGEDIKQVLRGYSLVPGQRKLSLRLLNRPYSPKIAQLLSDHGPAAVARQKTDSENLVLFSVDLARIGHYDVRHAIERDGRRRNLPWGLKDGGQNSIVRVDGEPQSANELAVSGAAAADRQPRRNVRSPARYILAFKNTEEARRFVREWHRRPFPVQKEHKMGDEAPAIMNVEMFR